MLIKTLILAFLVGVSPLLYSQNIAPAIEWQKCFGSSGLEGESGFSIWNHSYTDNTTTIVTADSGFIFARQAAYAVADGDMVGLTHHGESDIWVVKTSKTKAIEWQVLLGGSSWDHVYSVVQSPDGGYLVAGYTKSNDGDVVGHRGNMYSSDAWLVKLSATGSIQWTKCMGGSNTDGFTSVVNTTDGGYFVVGYSDSRDGNLTSIGANSWSGWVVKLSATGVIQWQKCLGGYSVDIFTSTRQTKDGGFIVAGMTPRQEQDRSAFDLWLVKIDSTGTTKWEKTYGGNGDDYANSIIQTQDGGYAIAGETYSVNSRDVTGGHAGTGFDVGDMWILKLSASGHLQWQKSFGGTRKDAANSILQTADDGYLVGGFTQSNDGDIANFYNERGDGWLIKLSPKGIYQWQKTIGGTGNDKINTILATPNGGYLAAGFTSSNDFDVSGQHGYHDAWLVKLTHDGKAIIGQVEQKNTMCQSLTPPQYMANARVKIEKNNTNFYLLSDSLGHFGVLIDTGRYNISAIPPNHLWTVCPTTAVVVTNPNVQDTTAANPTLYINSICPLIEVELTTPFLRRCFESQYVINYANRGTAVQNDATAELTLDSMLTYLSATRPVRSRVGNKITFSLGNVGINQTGQFTVNVMVSCDSRLGQTHCSSVLIPKTMTCDTVQDSIPTIINQCVAGCDSVSFLVSKPNTTLNKTFKHQLIADANLIDTGRFTLTNASTNTFNLTKKRDGRTYRLEIRNPVTNQLLVARSAESSPTVTTPSVSTGFVNQFSQSIKQANISDNCTANRGAFDPNDKAATPTGVGTRHFIEQGNTIDYLVQFQNTGTDTAFKVVVRDTLATQFDWATFKLNAQSHTAIWQLNPQGVLVVTFNNINLVDSFTNERGSHGFFKYSIKLKDSIVTNTVVTNKAAIYFDFNAPIITNLTTHTIGKEGLKSCLSKPAVTVNYSGCPSKNIVFNAVSTRSGANPTYAWYRNSETIPLSINANFTLTNATRGTKIYCKTTASSDLCTETPVAISDTIILNCIGVPTNELPVIQAFEVFPNPNTGVFTVKLNVVKPSKMQLTILNYLGQTIKNQTISADNYAETFDLSVMPNGMYVIKLTIDGQSVVKKVSVQ